MYKGMIILPQVRTPLDLKEGPFVSIQKKCRIGAFIVMFRVFASCFYVDVRYSHVFTNKFWPETVASSGDRHKYTNIYGGSGDGGESLVQASEVSGTGSSTKSIAVGQVSLGLSLASLGPTGQHVVWSQPRGMGISAPQCPHSPPSLRI